MTRSFAVLGVLLISASVVAQDKPTTVQSLWADFDPTSESLESKIVREWEEDGLVLRYVTYHIGTFKGRKAST